jgi:DNA-binding CsgD family transcriptional regulator
MNTLNSPAEKKRVVADDASSRKSAQDEVTLSERQLEIIALLAEGKSNKEIADVLKIGYGTVKQHLFVLFRKLGVTNRTKAVITASKLLKDRSGSLAVSAKKAKNKLTAVRVGGHSWRLVSAIVISAPDGNLATPQELEWRNQYFADLRDVLQAYVDALDGQFLLLPYGGMLAWFGYPNTHLDDADRAVKLAQFTQHWSDEYLTQNSIIDQEKRSAHSIGIGVASKPEMSSDRSNELFASDAFRLAAILARNARSVKHPLADALTQKLAPHSVPWLAIKAKAAELAQVGDIAAIGAANAPPKDASVLWGGLPFFQSAIDVVKSGVAQWVSVESWPPAIATSLIDALGNMAQLNGFQAICIRTPSHQRRDKLLQSFFKQSEYATADTASIDIELSVSAGEGERLGALFAQCSMQRPLVIQVYGIRALEALKFVLGDRGIDRIASRPIMVIAANLSESGSPQTSVRLLGPRPIEMPFSRVYSMVVPTQESLPEGIRVDLQAILDDLSPQAQALIISASQDANQSIENAITSLHLPHHQSQSALQELATIGFISAKQGGGFELRDLATAQAIQKLSIPRS